MTQQLDGYYKLYTKNSYLDFHTFNPNTKEESYQQDLLRWLISYDSFYNFYDTSYGRVDSFVELQNASIETNILRGELIYYDVLYTPIEHGDEFMSLIKLAKSISLSKYEIKKQLNDFNQKVKTSNIEYNEYKIRCEYDSSFFSFFGDVILTICLPKFKITLKETKRYKLTTSVFVIVN